MPRGIRIFMAGVVHKPQAGSIRVPKVKDLRNGRGGGLRDGNLPFGEELLRQS